MQALRLTQGKQKDGKIGKSMVTVAHLVERRSVAAEAAGSIPVSHPSVIPQGRPFISFRGTQRVFLEKFSPRIMLESRLYEVNQ